MTPEDRAAWLQKRKRNVGASEAGALLGVSPWKTRFELWHIKAGLLDEEDLSENQRVFWGQTLEPAVAAGVASEKRWTVHKVHRYIEHPTVQGMAASLDYEVVNHPKGPGVLEIKTCDYLQWRAWEEALPLVYEVQLQHQLAVNPRRTWGAVGLLVGGNDLKVFERERHDGVIQRLEVEVPAFWKSIAAKTPPPIDWNADADTVIALHQTATPKKVITLEATPELLEMLTQHVGAGAAIRDHERFQKTTKARLLEAMGDAEIAFCGGFKITAGVVEGGRVEAYDRAPYRELPNHEEEGEAVKKEKVPVTMRAVLQRINRVLVEKNQALKTTRDRRMREEAGDYFVVDRDSIVRKKVDPEELARDLGCLRAWEEVRK